MLVMKSYMVLRTSYVFIETLKSKFMVEQPKPVET